jgi:hypothetical protein
MTSDVDLRPGDTDAIAKGGTSPPPADPPLGWDNPVDLGGARLRRSEQAELDGRSTTPPALRRVVVLWCVLLGTLYAIGTWIIYAAM